jgi:hypothetical protein
MFLSKNSQTAEGGGPQAKGLSLGLIHHCKNRVSSDLRRVESMARLKQRRMGDVSSGDT